MIIRKKLSIDEIKQKANNLINQSDIVEFKNLINSDDILDVLCNSCGKSCKKENNIEGLIEAVVSGSEESLFLDKDSSIKFSICESCLKQIINNFKIPPSKRDDSVEFSDFIEPEVSQNNTKSLKIIKD